MQAHVNLPRAMHMHEMVACPGDIIAAAMRARIAIEGIGILFERPWGEHGEILLGVIEEHESRAAIASVTLSWHRNDGGWPRELIGAQLDKTEWVRRIPRPEKARGFTLRAIYSFVIDGGEKFEAQTRVFLTTLLATGVDPSCVLAHFTPSASAKSLQLAKRFGIELRPLEPFLDRKYCNKLAQLPVLIERSADMFVLCDTDLAFVTGIESLFSQTHIRAKPVDLPNPPIEVLEKLRCPGYNQKAPRIVQTTCELQPTYSVNCNGGLYIIPSALAVRISTEWRIETRRLIRQGDLIGPWMDHADQVGFALAMLECGLDVEEIPIEFNFPMHLGARLKQLSFDEPKVLHYHWLLEADGGLAKTGHPVVDGAVAKVNRILSVELA